MAASSRSAATAAPMPSSSGSTPAVSVASTSSPSAAPSSRARCSEVMTTAEAASASKQEFPAVTVPPSTKAAGNRARTAALSPAPRPVVRADGSRRSVSSGVISPLKRPAAAAARARWWLRSAKASCRSRLTPKRAATFSAATPMSGSPKLCGTNWARAKKSGSPSSFRCARKRRGADAFHSPGEVHRVAAGGHQPGREDDGVQARAALPVHGQPGHADREVRPPAAASRATLPPPPTALPITTSATACRGKPALGQELLQDRRQQLVRAQRP